MIQLKALNKYTEKDKETIILHLNNGKNALIDTEDLGLVARFRWYALKDHERFYAVSNVWRGRKKKKRVQMHNLIMYHKGIDHKDLDGLNNKKSNLREATGSQNQANKAKGKPGTSKYKGVVLLKNGKWQAQIKASRKYFYLGCFASEVDAAKAYDKRALEISGEFARPNIPSPTPKGAE